MSRQVELICGQCPIETGCDEESLFCVYRLLTRNPNDAQIRMRDGLRGNRTRYWSNRYQAKKEEAGTVELARYYSDPPRKTLADVLRDYRAAEAREFAESL